MHLYSQQERDARRAPSGAWCACFTIIIFHYHVRGVLTPNHEQLFTNREARTMKPKPYIITMTEVHAFEYHCHAVDEQAALEWLEEGMQPHTRKKILDRTIEITQVKQPKPNKYLKRYFR